MPNLHPRRGTAAVCSATARAGRSIANNAPDFSFLLNAHRRTRRLTPLAELIGNALVKRLGTDGQLDPATTPSLMMSDAALGPSGGRWQP